MTFTAVGGCSIGCVKLLGITSFPINEFESVALSSHLSNYEDELLLVFERASEGSLPGFMERELQGTTGTESWTVVLDTLSSIARGLANIHGHGIIHGYRLCTAYAIDQILKITLFHLLEIYIQIIFSSQR